MGSCTNYRSVSVKVGPNDPKVCNATGASVLLWSGGNMAILVVR